MLRSSHFLCAHLGSRHFSGHSPSTDFGAHFCAGPDLAVDVAVALDEFTDCETGTFLLSPSGISTAIWTGVVKHGAFRATSAVAKTALSCTILECSYRVRYLETTLTQAAQGCAEESNTNSFRSTSHAWFSVIHSNGMRFSIIRLVLLMWVRISFHDAEKQSAHHEICDTPQIMVKLVLK